MRRPPILLTLALAASVLVTVGALPASAEPVVQAQLVQTIDASAFNPPSPDPSGLTFLPSGKLLMSDGEVDETPHWEKRNVWIFSVDGDVASTFRTTKYSSEPAGIEATRKQLYIADDVKDAIFVVKRGRDHKYGTRDDQVRSFGTGRLGCRDPEGIALGGRFLFIASGSDGADPSVCRLSRGRNGRFDGTGAKGDDRVNRFKTTRLGQPDPEGIAYRRSTKTLFLVSSLRNSPISEVSIRGRLVRTIETDGLGMRSPAGLAWGPASTSGNHLWVADRRVDNVADPNENDGQVFEISF
jgi:hypothetical protein